MNKKHGFTLTELLVVIVILAIIITIAVPTYSTIVKKVNDKQYENKLALVETVSLKYADDTNYSSFYIDDLIKNGYIEPDRDGFLIDNRDNKTIMNCYVVTIEEKDGQNYAKIYEKNDELDKDFETNRECRANIPNKLSKTIKIEMKYKNDDKIVEYNKVSGYWIKDDVILNLIFVGSYKEELESKINSGDAVIEWYRGYELLKTGKYYSLDVNSSSVLQQNYSVKVIDNSSNKTYAASVRVYIDKISPNFYENDASNLNINWTNKIDYNILGYDNESGLYGYLLLKEKNSCPTDDKLYSSVNKKNKIEENGIYYACLMDNAKNVSNAKEIKIDHLDKAKMECNLETSGLKKNQNSDWYTDDVILTVTPVEVGASGVYLAINDMKNTFPNLSSHYESGTPNIKYSVTRNKSEGNIKNKKYYGHIKNKTNATSVCEAEVNVEVSMESPNYIEHTSGVDSIKVKFKQGNAISKISSTTCLLSLNGEVVGNTEISGNSCKNGEICECNIPITINKLSGSSQNYNLIITSKSNAGNTASTYQNNIKDKGLCSLYDSNYSFTNNTNFKASTVENWDYSCSCNTVKKTGKVLYYVENKANTNQKVYCGYKNISKNCQSNISDVSGQNKYVLLEVLNPSSNTNPLNSESFKYSCRRASCEIKNFTLSDNPNHNCYKKVYSNSSGNSKEYQYDGSFDPSMESLERCRYSDLLDDLQAKLKEKSMTYDDFVNNSPNSNSNNELRKLIMNISPYYGNEITIKQNVSPSTNYNRAEEDMTYMNFYKRWCYDSATNSLKSNKMTGFEVSSLYYCSSSNTLFKFYLEDTSSTFCNKS
ncbi:MAG: prepilin-type N-terminal cleavage/methylation domain-containing protein [Firmicutes bacterium]|nr:prepilin-type N-terminal cleavage/methylation domain-containing protein [Bacillota bacterium]